MLANFKMTAARACTPCLQQACRALSRLYEASDKRLVPAMRCCHIASLFSNSPPLPRPQPQLVQLQGRAPFQQLRRFCKWSEIDARMDTVQRLFTDAREEIELAREVRSASLFRALHVSTAPFKRLLINSCSIAVAIGEEQIAYICILSCMCMCLVQLPFIPARTPALHCWSCCDKSVTMSHVQHARFTACKSEPLQALTRVHGQSIVTQSHAESAGCGHSVLQRVCR